MFIYIQLINESLGNSNENINITREQYQNNRKKNSAFRKSQHEINLNSLNEDESYALKYHQIIDEKNKINIKLQAKQVEVNEQNNNLLKIKEILRNNKGFKKELNMMVQNGSKWCKLSFRILRYVNKLFIYFLCGIQMKCKMCICEFLIFWD